MSQLAMSCQKIHAGQQIRMETMGNILDAIRLSMIGFVTPGKCLDSRPPKAVLHGRMTSL